MIIKIAFFFSIIIVSMQSCKSQNTEGFDLSKDAIGKHIDGVIQNDVEIENMAVTLFPGSDDILQTQSGNALNFFGVNYSGYVEKGKNLGANDVIFSYGKIDSLINFYQLHTYQTERANQLIEQLNAQLGTAVFTGYSVFGNTSKEGVEFNAKIWIDHDHKIAYFLNRSLNTIIYQKEETTIDLYAVDMTKEMYYEYFATSTPWNLYGSYYRYKNKRDKPESYSYKNFVEEKLAEGIDKYAKFSDY